MLSTVLSGLAVCIAVQALILARQPRAAASASVRVQSLPLGELPPGKPRLALPEFLEQPALKARPPHGN